MKAQAAMLIKQADYEESPAKAVTPEEWTPGLVKSCLVEAYQILSDTTGYVGPAKSKGFWPEFPASFEDLCYRAEIEQVRTRVRRRQRTSIEIKRMEIILLGWKDRDGNDCPAWLNGQLLNYKQARKCLIAHVMCQIYGVKVKEMCRAHGWPETTFRRHRDFAAVQVAENLGRIGLEVWGA